MNTVQLSTEGNGPGWRSLSFLRISVAGFFMGLANLVPGVSGGTMVLALGLYEDFISSFSDLTRFKFSKRSLLLVGSLLIISFLTIIVMAGLIQFLMESIRPFMLALFIGLTLGGAPILFRRVKPFNFSAVISCLTGFLLMGIVAFILRPSEGSLNILMFFIGGVVGSAAMILPGISGSYLLLVMGLYLPIITAINDFKYALKIKNWAGLIDIGVDVVLPFGIGLVVGIVLLSNTLKYLLIKMPKMTESVLLGILIGSVLGLYPFQPQSFNKLIRYANKVDAGEMEVRVAAYGWSPKNNPEIYSKLKEIETEKIRLNLIDNNHSKVLTREEIKKSKENKAIIIVFGQPVDASLRDIANNGKLGKIPLIVVPDTNFSITRGLGAIILILFGFLLTYFIGRFKETPN